MNLTLKLVGMLAAFIFAAQTSLAQTQEIVIPSFKISPTQGLKWFNPVLVVKTLLPNGVPFLISNQTLVECATTTDQLRDEISSLLDTSLAPDHGIAIRAASHVSGAAPQTILQTLLDTQVHFLITRQPVLARDDFSSFYFKDYPHLSRPVIALNCNSTIAHGYWPASLAHELTHAFLSKRGLPRFLDEAMAMLAERDTGGTHPDLTEQNFARDQNFSRLPSLYVDQSPYFDARSYPMSYLLAQYIETNWGGLTTLQAMTEGHTLSGVFDSGQKSLAARHFKDQPMERFTPNGVLRNFAMGFIVASPRQELWRIPGWGRIESRFIPEDPILDPTGEDLKPGQFFVAPVKVSDPMGSRFSSQVEVYRVRYSPFLNEVVPRTQPKPFESALSEDSSELMLVLKPVNERPRFETGH